MEPRVTFIAAGSAGPNGEGGRTVTNCTVYDRRKVYEVTTSAVLDVCQSNMGGEVERTGETVTNTIVYHIIATSEDLARALFKDRWGSKFQRHTLINIKLLFCIDEEIVTRHN